MARDLCGRCAPNARRAQSPRRGAIRRRAVLIASRVSWSGDHDTTTPAGSWFLTPGSFRLQLLHVDVAEVERVAVVLELDGAFGIEGLVALPVVFHRDLIDDELVVELHADLVADDLDPERVPLADRLIGLGGGLLGILLIVEDAAGAFVFARL